MRGPRRKKASEVQELAGLEEAEAEREELLDPKHPQAGGRSAALVRTVVPPEGAKEAFRAGMCVI